MFDRPFSTDHLDYLTRSNCIPGPLPPNAAFTSAPPALRRLWRVQGVGYPDKAGRPAWQPPEAQRLDMAQGSSSQRPMRLGAERNAGHLASEDILGGLHGYKIPVAFIVWGEPGNLAVHLGVWSQGERENAPANVLDGRMSILGAILNSLYPSVELIPTSQTEINRPPAAGIAMGIPTARPADPLDGALPLDRLGRAMQGTRWACLVLAEPMTEAAVINMRQGLINEMRSAQTGAEVAKTPSPLAHYYTELLDVSLQSMTEAQAIGLWRTAVYLIGDEISYHRLASAWRSIFSGENSLPEPVRVVGLPQAADLAVRWAMPDTQAPPGPGGFQHPFLYQTPLTSSQLAAYIHLPALETCGFRVRATPQFDVVPQTLGEGEAMALGQVLENTRPTGVPYRIRKDDLSRHALVAGVTGSGKTNTVFSMLKQLWSWHVPFLVLEPAKTEYRSLLNDPQIGPDLQIFTLGDEQVSPLRLNPFEVEPGVPLATHLDLLKSVFNASFGMWNPLPQVLERCMHAVYREYGWDSIRGTNHRVENLQSTAERREAFPTLTDLHDMVEEVVQGLGYEDRVTGDLKAALLTRLNSLRIGGKGVMLDTRNSIPLDDLLHMPTILELEPIGDDDEKAFVMGLLLIRLYEHLRATGSVEGVGMRHLVIIEEAHRLLANVPMNANPEVANVRGKAVETFGNMLSEIRAYGEGFIVAEQIPGKLALDVIKNTNLKIVHRMVAGDDRLTLSQTMNMTGQQSDMLATLSIGQAAVFAEGDDRPVLVQIPYSKIPASKDMNTKAEGDRRVATHMAGFHNQPQFSRLFVPFAGCPQKCGTPYRYCEASRALLAAPEFQALFSLLPLSLAIPELPVGNLLRQLGEYLASRLAGNTPPERSGALACLCMHASRWYLTYYGRRYAWSYAVVDRLQNRLVSLLMDLIPVILGVGEPKAPADGRQEYTEAYLQACHRSSDPFWACSLACPQNVCLFRHHAARLLTDRHLSDAFDQALTRAGQRNSLARMTGKAAEVWDDLRIVDDAIFRLIGYRARSEFQRSAGLCYAIQWIAAKPGMLDPARRAALEGLMQAADRRGFAQE